MTVDGSADADARVDGVRALVSPRILVRAAVVTAVLLVAAWYTRMLQTPQLLGAAFWSSGVAVTALLVSPRRSWPAILTGIVVFVPVAGVLDGVPVVFAAVWAVGTLARTLVVAMLVERWGATPLDATSRVLRFVVAAFIGSTVSAVIVAVAGAVWPLDPRLDAAQLAGDWFTGDALGIIVTVPLALVVMRRIPVTRVWGAEGIAALTLVVAACAMLNFVDDAHLAALLLLLVLLPAMWLAARFRIAGAAISNFVVAHLLVVISVAGRGPFVAVQFAPLDRAVLLRQFLFVFTIIALLLAARTVESATYHDLAEHRATLLAAVSHELRAPLNAVVGFAELLRTRDDATPHQRSMWVDAVETGGRRLTRLVDDMLLVSRADRGKIPAEPERLDLGGVVRAVLAERADDDVRVEVADPTDAYADPAHVAQIVHNLVDNAVRHGRPPVAVEVAAEAGAVRLAITDAGEGVSAEVADRIFEPFAQADGHGSGGLGLGLNICRELVEVNGGSLELDASHRPGARFVLTLPAA